MGWRSKVLFLLIVYFAGFATAVYYLAPSGENSQQTNSFKCISGEKLGTAAGTFEGFCGKALNKASAGFSSMKTKEFNDYFNKGLQRLMEMTKPSSASAGQEGEDK